MAVTHPVSNIPQDVLMSLSTKVIFGNEMGIELRAIMEYAAQDFTDEPLSMAAPGPDEAIVSSALAPFAVPIRVPLFDDMAANSLGAGQPEQAG